MEKLAGRPIERFTPHDFRRTTRSNTKRLKVDYETAEAMLNHVKKGLERTYDRYELEDEKRASFLKWETNVAEIARRAGVADALGVPASPLNLTLSPEWAETDNGPDESEAAGDPAVAQPDATAPMMSVIRLAGTFAPALSGYAYFSTIPSQTAPDAGSRFREKSRS
jgi:hypothetical protein